MNKLLALPMAIALSCGGEESDPERAVDATAVLDECRTASSCPDDSPECLLDAGCSGGCTCFKADTCGGCRDGCEYCPAECDGWCDQRVLQDEGWCSSDEAPAAEEACLRACHAGCDAGCEACAEACGGEGEAEAKGESDGEGVAESEAEAEGEAEAEAESESACTPNHDPCDFCPAPGTCDPGWNGDGDCDCGCDGEEADCGDG